MIDFFKDWARVDEDEGREMDLLMAKLQPFDGETVYARDRIGGIDFLGYETRRYQKAHPKLRRTLLVGTTIIRHERVSSDYSTKAASDNNAQNDSRNWTHYFITPGLEDEYRWALREEEYERKIGRFREDEKF